MIKRLIKNREFEKNALILFLAAMICNLSNYFFQIIMARFLSVEQYGTVNALFSLLVLLALPLPTLVLIVTKYIAESAIGGLGSTIYTSKIFLKYVMRFAILFGLLLLIFLVPIADYMKITNYTYVLLIIIITVLGYASSVFYGYLQGIKSFKDCSILYAVPAMLKVLIGVPLLYIGFKVYGVLLVLILSSLATIALGWLLYSKYLRVTDVLKKDEELNKTEIIRYAVYAGIISFMIGLLSNIDILFVKHYFSSYDAGLYSSVSILGKMMLYIPIAVTSVMFPSIVEANKLGQNYFLLFFKALIYNFVLIGIAIFVLNIFADFFVRLLFGIEYINAIPFLLPICIAAGILGLLFVISNFLLAISKANLLSGVLLIGMMAYFILVTLIHGSILEILYILIFIVSIILLVSLLYILFLFHNKCRRK